jgi:peptide/nickel transport system ATP-binding protein
MFARETLGLVGESGSGKTTLGRAILGLTAIKRGAVFFAGQDITHSGYKERRELSANLQVVFQDPYSSLNPTRTIGQTLAETLRVHHKYTKGEIRQRVVAMLDRVGLSSDSANRYPAHFSGGQRQRVAIARALMVQPRLVICDEPVSSLDLSVQAQVLNLLRELQEDFHLSYLFIAHDLSVVRHLSHRLVVLYRGRVMEQGDAVTLYSHPLHPYTQALLDTAPTPDPELQRQRRTKRTMPIADEATSLTRGCIFAPRCLHAIERCWSEEPSLEPGYQGSLIACHRWRELRELNVDRRVSAPYARME